MNLNHKSGVVKLMRFLIFGLLAAATVRGGQVITNSGWLDIGCVDSLAVPDDGSASGPGPAGVPDPPAIAEAITPDIQALADGLEHDPVRIFNYVHDHIRYVLYFGSEKGAELTLLEKSGNDFDQSALLVALLRAAGYTNAAYQFGWMLLPYENPDGSHRDLHHWLGLSLTNSDWGATHDYLDYLFKARRAYPIVEYNLGTNTFAFQRVWVTLPIGGTTNYLDPAFKVSEPILAVTNLPAAMGTNAAGISNALLSAAQGVETNSYVTNLDEASLRSTLNGYTASLLGFLQSNYPNASVEDILSGRYIVPSTNATLSQGLLFPTTNMYGTMPVLNWTNQPTSMMSWLKVDAGYGSHQWFLPELKGDRLSLTANSNGLLQFWQEDTNLWQYDTSGSARFKYPVLLIVYHPSVQSGWDTTNNVLMPGPKGWTAWKNYLSRDASYAFTYAFEPDWGWLRQRQQKLDASRQRLPDTSREAVTETLNVMGLNWQTQVEYLGTILAAQIGELPQFYHRKGRMAQESGFGYYVDVHLAASGQASDRNRSEEHTSELQSH